jgi:hypothetical protein
MKSAKFSAPVTPEEQQRGIERFAGLAEPVLPPSPICCGVASVSVGGGYGCPSCLRPHDYFPPQRGPRGRYDGRVVSRFNPAILGHIDAPGRRVIADDGRVFKYGPLSGPRDVVWICWAPAS